VEGGEVRRVVGGGDGIMMVRTFVSGRFLSWSCGLQNWVGNIRYRSISGYVLVWIFRSCEAM